MRSHAKSHVDSSLLRLLVLISMEIGLVDLLYRLGSLPFLRTPGADPPAWRLWLASTPPQDAVAAVLRLAATAAAWWLHTPTPVYVTQVGEERTITLADGSGLYTKTLGLEMDLTQRGMGVRSQRFSMLVVDGVVKALNVEQPGKFEVSDAETLLKQAEKHIQYIP